MRIRYDPQTIEAVSYSESWFEWCRMFSLGVRDPRHVCNYVIQKIKKLTWVQMSLLNSALGSEWTTATVIKKNWLNKSEVPASKIAKDSRSRREHKEFLRIEEKRLRQYSAINRNGRVADDLGWVTDPVDTGAVIAEDDLLYYFASKIEPTVKKLMNANHDKSLHVARLFISLCMEETGNTRQWEALEQYGINTHWFRSRIRKRLKQVMEDYYSRE